MLLVAVMDLVAPTGLICSGDESGRDKVTEEITDRGPAGNHGRRSGLGGTVMSITNLSSYLLRAVIVWKRRVTFADSPIWRDDDDPKFIQAGGFV